MSGSWTMQQGNKDDSAKQQLARMSSVRRFLRRLTT